MGFIQQSSQKWGSPESNNTGGPPNRSQQPLALTWLRLSGCAALVPPRCARYPVGVIQHPEDCPLTEATGLVLVLRRPKRGQACVRYQEAWLRHGLSLRWHRTASSVHVCLRLAGVKVSGVSYFLVPWTLAHTLYFPFPPPCSKAHKGSSPRSLQRILSDLLQVPSRN